MAVGYKHPTRLPERTPDRVANKKPEAENTCSVADTIAPIVGNLEGMRELLLALYATGANPNDQSKRAELLARHAIQEVLLADMTSVDQTVIKSPGYETPEIKAQQTA